MSAIVLQLVYSSPSDPFPNRRQEAKWIEIPWRMSADHDEIDVYIATHLSPEVIAQAEAADLTPTKYSYTLTDPCDNIVPDHWIAAVETVNEQAEEDRMERILADTAAWRRDEEIRNWVAYHGSETLKLQLSCGYRGWPLYLHERAAFEIGVPAHLEKDAESWDPVLSPTLEQLQYEMELSKMIGVFPGTPGEIVRDHLKWRRSPGNVPVLVITGYVPGDPSNGWPEYTLIVDRDASTSRTNASVIGGNSPSVAEALRGEVGELVYLPGE